MFFCECVKNICDNLKFEKVVKPLLSNKIMSNEQIALVEGTKILKSDKETAKVLNNFFSTIMKSLKIPQYKEQEQDICFPQWPSYEDC